MPLFFKVMIGDFSTKLRIPPAFVKHLDHVLHPKFILKTRNGQKSFVHLKKVERNVYFFEKGWKLFVEKNHIKFGDFLVFKCVGEECSEIKVRVFGKNACEKEVAPLDATTKGKNVMNSDENDDESDDSVVEIITPTQAQGKFFKMRVSREEAQKPSSSRVRTGVLQEKTKANEEAANTFTSKHPYFKLVMFKSYLHHQNAAIPKSFLMEHIRRGYHNVTLWSPPQSSWSVKLINGNHRGRFGAGWLEFVNDNNLQEGDVCFFELFATDNIVLKVSVIR